MMMNQKRFDRNSFLWSTLAWNHRQLGFLYLEIIGYLGKLKKGGGRQTSWTTATTRRDPPWSRSGSSSNSRAVRQPQPFGALGSNVPESLKLPKTITSLFEGQISWKAEASVMGNNWVYISLKNKAGKIMGVLMWCLSMKPWIFFPILGFQRSAHN